MGYSNLYYLLEKDYVLLHLNKYEKIDNNLLPFYSSKNIEDLSAFESYNTFLIENKFKDFLKNKIYFRSDLIKLIEVYPELCFILYKNINEEIKNHKKKNLRKYLIYRIVFYWG